MPGPTRWRLLRLGLATILIVLALFGLWQAWVIHGRDRARVQVGDALTQARQGIDDALAAQRARIDQALSDPALQRALAAATPAGRAAAQARAHALLPRLQQIQFYRPDLDEVVHADYRQFGYARASQLLRLLDPAQQPRVGAVLHSGRHQLSLARPVRDAAGTLLAWGWFAWPMSSLQAVLAQTNPGAGRVVVRIGAGPGGLALLAHGGSRTVDGFAPGQPIAHSMFWISTAMPLLPIVLPLPAWLVLVLAIVALLAGAVLLWSRLDSHSPAPVEEPELSEISPSRPVSTPASTPAPAPTAATRPPPAVAVDANIFRAYDIRGVVGKQLTKEVAHLLGQAIGALMREQDLDEIVIGRDGRLSGPELLGGLADGLRAAGIDVIDVGAVPTPLVYFAAFHFNTGSGVAVTGSHNPPDYNGFKIVVGGETLSDNAIQDLYRRILAGFEPAPREGNYRQADVIEEYIDRVTSDVQVERPLKVVADAGNGIAGKIAQRLLEGVGCEVTPLFCEVDGTFPNHHPDPSNPDNLQDLIQAVQAMDADIGVAFDGDGDRLGVVTREGEIIYPDRVLVLFARDVLSRVPGATIIYDVKCTGHLGPEVLKAGGSPLMWRTGHSLIKAKMRQTEAQLAGEMSGHFFFRERWYGFDDGLYSATRLLEILAGDIDGRSAEEIFATVPKGVATPELKIALEEGQNHPFIERFQQQARFEDARLTTIDGLRADWPDGWGLVRASNTTPVLVLRFDAETEAALERIKQRFAEQLLALDPELKLPF